MTATNNSGAAGAGDAIAQGAACVGCGYDLRGSPRDGRCPECGLAVAVSMDAAASRAPSVLPVDVPWQRQMIDAAGLGLAAFASTLAAAATLYWESPFRMTLWAILTLAVSGGLRWYGTIKLGRAPRIPRRGRAGGVLVWAMYALATINLFGPLLSAIAERPDVGELAGRAAKAALKLATPLALATYYLQLGVVFRRLGAHASAGQAWMLAVLAPLVAASGYLFTDRYLFLNLYRAATDEGGVLGVYAMLAAIPLWGAYLLGRMLVLLWKVPREDRP